MSRYRRLVDVAFIVVSLAANYGQTGVTDTGECETGMTNYRIGPHRT